MLPVLVSAIQIFCHFSGVEELKGSGRKDEPDWQRQVCCIYGLDTDDKPPTFVQI
jgi:hypothetical protein